jgi:hypothetical protein
MMFKFHLTVKTERAVAVGSSGPFAKGVDFQQGGQRQHAN